MRLLHDRASRLDIDRKREQSLGHVRVRGGGGRQCARRVGENVLIVGWAQRSLVERVAAYRFALERLIIAVPSPLAVEGRALDHVSAAAQCG